MIDNYLANGWSFTTKTELLFITSAFKCQIMRNINICLVFESHKEMKAGKQTYEGSPERYARAASIDCFTITSNILSF